MSALGSLPRLRAACTCAALLLLGGCAVTPSAEVGSSAWAERSGQQSVASPQSWQHQTFPGKTASRFRYARLDGRDTISAHADASASMLRQKVRIAPADLARVRFSWKVPGLIPLADMAMREKDDAPVRIVLAFEGDRSLLSARDSALSDLARVLTGEEMPYATLMYVWCNQREPGSVIVNPRTDRVRKIVVESGTRRLNQWLEYERDIRADYERAFGEKPGALVGIAIMTDGDNTRSSTQAWYGPVHFGPAAAR
jgi:Protein of unknown function (DUF3047)